MIKRFSQFTAVFLLILLTINWWGCAKKEPEYITIGSILPLTGEGSQYGDACKKGIDLAIEEINQTGGINGKKIRVIYEDDQLKAGPGTQAMNKLVSVDKVKVVLGAVASSVTLAIAPIANQNKVVLFSSVSTSHDVTDAGDYIFRNVASDIYDG
ncbi:MAG: ABC transporter substrate-binding protein, partial [Candidatus Omnitrophica bacterium]|nr:ABC transporter substrate-binding protein [Candidatus Omnitrophota bacterium]